MSDKTSAVFPEPASDQGLSLYRDHCRHFEHNLFVYPVLSRRSRGISIGVNLNPDKICNFDCVYCQVDRQTPPLVNKVDEVRLLGELEAMLDLVLAGRLFEDQRFAQTPSSLRRLNDIAFSGDGEPTTYPGFARVVEQVAAILRRRHLDNVKLVLITNATMLHRPEVQRALAILDTCHGEIWAKLDAGTEDYYRAIERTSISLERVIANILDAARIRPVVIQSLWLRFHGRGPSDQEIAAYCSRLGEILAGGGRIARVQLYTVARKPAVAAVEPLPRLELERIGEIVRRDTSIDVDIFQ